MQQIGTATGQQSFAHEQSQLVADKTTPLVHLLVYRGFLILSVLG
jgi:hypothetical protein